MKNWIEPKPEIRKMKEWEAAWLAGVIDSDGSFGLYDYGREGRRVLIQVANVDQFFLQRVKEVIGCGSSVLHIPSLSHKGRRPMYNFALKGSARCYWVLDQIAPYLIIKQDKAIEILTELESKPFGRWANATPEAKKKSADSLRERWADPAMREKIIAGMRRHYANKKQ